MELAKRRIRHAFSAAVILALVAAGCGDGDDSAAQEETGMGAIVIDLHPERIAGAGWSLTGPQNAAGTGDTMLADMPAGVYILTWSEVEGYLAPPRAKRTLAAGETIVFGGGYVSNPGQFGHFVLIPAGTFSMGSSVFEYGRDNDEIQHTVTLTRSFYMSATEVTNRQFAKLAQWAYDNGYCTATSRELTDALDGSTQRLMLFHIHNAISFSEGRFTVAEGMEEHPVVYLTWYGAARYCDWLSLWCALERAYEHAGDWSCNGGDPYAAEGYRLPTEAEWEYACRAGAQTPFNTGVCIDSGTDGNFDGSFSSYPGCSLGPKIGSAVPVASYPANAFGLYDMHGNVIEWCNDWYGPYGGDAVDPAGPAAGILRVRRNCAFSGNITQCRSGHRMPEYPYHFAGSIGFRPVRIGY